MNTASLCLVLLIGLISALGVMSACYNYPGEPCIHNNRAFAPEERWDNGQCQECACHRRGEPRGYHCCDSFSVPIYDVNKCDAVFDVDSCSYKLLPMETASESSINTTEVYSWNWSSWALPSWFQESDDESDCLLFAGGVM
ncbi:uncharacterized protein [Amphiura filiformis]|uniref:uncharacterized protein n=1 Tax=Amphiura filiformis TaxID=82378 RepID=UPI003B21F342